MANFILLPATQTQTNEDTNPKVKDFLTTVLEPAVKSELLKLNARMPARQEKKIPVKVLDSIQEDGAKLVELSNDELADFRFSYPGFRIIREKFYKKAIIYREAIEKKAKKNQINNKLQITVTDKAGNLLKDIYIVAFTDFVNRLGDSGTTNSKGRVTLNLKGKRIQRMYVYPEHSYWGYYRSSFTATTTLNIALTSIDINYKDVLRHFYHTAGWPSIPASIRIAVIDTGVGPHKDLMVSGGMNCVKDEDPKDYKDNGEGHGTHVAGIIGASGGIHGMAAGVEIFSYRVFPVGQAASNFYIMKAINQAILDRCDLINMSLGEAEQDEGIISYIKQAYNAGVLCFCANGNDDREKVSFPASYSLSVAVSAMGRKKTFPARTVQTAIIKAPYGKDKANFIADFSNIGPETDLTAPGVGIISTFPNDRYAIMDGTSMACPAATGMAARLLSAAPEILAMPRTQARADEMLKYLSARIKSLGFKPIFEGKGMLLGE
ncbi:S8 family serine peptidase [Chitinophaga filiformis]|uniref:S8 family serine peptidase n=1 Tax=Chitinophaga filiformis TaxID=104663 RepID=UPI001F468097|nr:S8 family serine peptidase [Chitinophaga filiformis]MCF6402864.1 S8 family serine peptidase [Chitinophaga filiformis]MCF6403218.1 S8 family serine peptidase [Chitinophaga filiformis]